MKEGNKFLRYRYLIKLFLIKKKRKGHKNIRLGAGAGAVIRIYGFAEPEPKAEKNIYGSTTLLESPELPSLILL